MLDQTTDLRSLLKDPSLFETRAYVAGEWIVADDGKTFAVTNPARGDVIAQVADLTRAEVARAIAASEAAMKDWAKRTGKERAAVLRRWYALAALAVVALLQEVLQLILRGGGAAFSFITRGRADRTDPAAVYSMSSRTKPPRPKTSKSFSSRPND